MSADQTLTLSQAIGRLYRVFAKYKSEGLSGCYKREEVSLYLQRAELRSLSVEDIGGYLGSAMTTWGDAVDLKHFLPRVLELCVGDPDGIELWLVNSKLVDAAWTSWPKVEQEAVRDFLNAYWRAWLNIRPDSHSFTRLPTSDLLLTINHLLHNLDVLLAYWDECQDDEADLHLAMMVDWGAYDSFRAFGRGPESSLKLLRWVCRPAIRVRLETAFFGAKDETAQRWFSDATTYHAVLCDRLRTITEK